MSNHQKKPHIDLEKFDDMVSSFSKREIYEKSMEGINNSRAEYKEFERRYNSGRCYMCGLKFWDMDKFQPCIHWLLKPRAFKKKQFEQIYQEFNYHQISSFLHWVANKEKFLKNINNLKSEKQEKKLFSYTIVWKNIEWTFDCAYSDYQGHIGTKFTEPHYHFQMRIDGRQFINFNDYHIPFTEYDLFNLDLQQHRNGIYQHSYGPGGSGMQEAIDVDPEFIIENTVSSENEDQAVYRMNTFIEANGEEGIPGELLDQIYAEHKETGKTMASLTKKYLGEKASIKTIITPVDSIPDIAERKGGRGNKKRK